MLSRILKIKIPARDEGNRLVSRREKQSLCEATYLHDAKNACDGHDRA
jgi:hypothetical protein